MPLLTNQKSRLLGSGMRYLIRDDFATDLAAGAVNNTRSDSDVGIGLRTTIETDGSVSTSGGVLVLSGQTTAVDGDLGYYYSFPIGRAVGRTVEFRIRRHGLAAGECYGIGLFANPPTTAANRVHTFRILNNDSIYLRGDPTGSTGVALPDNTWATLKIVLKATGCDYYVDNVLKGSGTTSTTTPLYVGVGTGTLPVDVEYIKVWGGGDWGHLCITFDDSRANMYAGFQYAAARGVMGTSYCITNNVDVDLVNSLTSAQLLAMDAAGWAIGNHTAGHVQLATLTEAQQEAQLAEGTADLNAWGLTRASRHVAYPNNSYNADTLAAMAATGMLTGRTVDTAADNDPATVNPYLIPVAYGTVLTATTVAQLQTAVRNSIARGKWGFLLFHGLADTPASGEWSTAKWQEFINWLVASGVKTRTIVDYYNARGGA